MRLGREALAVLGGVDESLDHLGRDIVAVEVVQFPEPEVVPVEVRIRRGVRVTTQVADVLHVDERAVELRLGYP